MALKPLVFTAASYAYTKILPLFQSASAPESSSPTEPADIAAVCDPMTWQNMRQSQRVVSLTPKNWKETLDTSKNVKLFFCEASWSGITGNCWRGQIYKDKRVLYENRRELLRILEYCKSKAIPAVFWAKEDPAYFCDSTYDFTDTALRFDYILTTAEECIPKYNELGHTKVYLWPFGFSEDIYHPPDGQAQRERAAVFAGSWYEDHPKRCEALASIFDMIMDTDIPLKIYDRQRVKNRSPKPFPKKYQPFVRDSIPYDALGDVYRSVEYAINVNTVSDSETMFSRRVYEAMACGCIVISNDSAGMRRQFGQQVWFSGEEFDFGRSDEIRSSNADAVLSSHTWAKRMELLRTILETKEPK